MEVVDKDYGWKGAPTFVTRGPAGVSPLALSVWFDVVVIVASAIPSRPQQTQKIARR